MIWLTVLAMFVATFSPSESYKILAVFQLPTGSHYILASKLFTEIAKKGHDVTFITPFAQKYPIKNMKEIPIESLQHLMQGVRKNFYESEGFSPLLKAKLIMELSYNLTEHLLLSEKVQKLLKSEEQYDAVIIYQYMNDGLLGIAHHFKAPLILFSSMPLYVPESFLLAHPTPSSYVPNILTEYSSHMNFWERLGNSFYDVCMILYYQWAVLPKHRELVRNHIPGSPDLYEFLNNASLILINSHVSTNEALPQVPNAVEIGGYHIEEPKKLPEHLQTFLDESVNGVVVFSMGSILKTADFPIEKRQAVLRTFSKLKQNVLWKWEDDDFLGLPKNVKIMKWLPLSDVLAHSNVKAFISHGGLLSTMESVYYGVPFVGIPVMADQKMNMAIAVSNGYGVQVPFQELTERKLSSALDDVLNNSKYKTNVRKRSAILRDRSIKPLDSALYWIEYVIRHDGARHLRYPGMDLNWYQRNLLDVVAFIIVTSFLSICLIVVTLRRIFLRISRPDGKHKKKE